MSALLVFIEFWMANFDVGGIDHELGIESYRLWEPAGLNLTRRLTLYNIQGAKANFVQGRDGNAMVALVLRARFFLQVSSLPIVTATTINLARL
jgi:hypothetical protein